MLERDPQAEQVSGVRPFNSFIWWSEKVCASFWNRLFVIDFISEPVDILKLYHFQEIANLNICGRLTFFYKTTSLCYQCVMKFSSFTCNTTHNVVIMNPLPLCFVSAQ